jgi:hypothetical protein
MTRLSLDLLQNLVSSQGKMRGWADFSPQIAAKQRAQTSRLETNPPFLAKSQRTLISTSETRQGFTHRSVDISRDLRPK